MIKFVIVIILQYPYGNSATSVTYEASFTSQESCENHLIERMEKANGTLSGRMFAYCVGKYNE